MISGNAPPHASVPFGVTPAGEAVELHTLTNASGMEVCFLSLGGIISAVKIPDRNGVIADVTPGYDTLEEYLRDTSYFGALVGRYANRIAHATFELDGVRYTLTANDGDSALHGGIPGFHHVVWTVAPFAADGSVGAVLSYTSPDGEAGFPGTVDVRVTYTLTDANELCFEYTAQTDRPTPINLTQHTYFNLAGHAAGEILEHELFVNASHYLPVDDDLVPLGAIVPVEGTPFDFRSAHAIGRDLPRRGAGMPVDGYDHAYVLDDGTAGAMRLAARLYEPTSGRTLEIVTTEPSLQFYGGDQLGDGPPGKEGRTYVRYGALALETQHFPNSVNMPDFPSTILRPGEEYRSRSVYRFGCDDRRPASGDRR
jgi:aldose 1-epimerase